MRSFARQNASLSWRPHARARRRSLCFVELCFLHASLLVVLLRGCIFLFLPYAILLFFFFIVLPPY